MNDEADSEEKRSQLLEDKGIDNNIKNQFTLFLLYYNRLKETNSEASTKEKSSKELENKGRLLCLFCSFRVFATFWPCRTRGTIRKGNFNTI